MAETKLEIDSATLAALEELKRKFGVPTEAERSDAPFESNAC